MFYLLKTNKNIGLYLTPILCTMGVFLFFSSVQASVRINEFLPNPVDEDNEWIELKNTGGQSIDLSGWKVNDLTKDFFISDIDFANTQIEAGGFFILPKSITKISLNNSSPESLQLWDDQNNLVYEISYTNASQEDFSYAVDTSNVWQWTQFLTPNAENVFDNSDNGDTDNNGDDGQTSNEDYTGKIVINELVPNPSESDDFEWIELKNISAIEIDVQNWTIEDASHKKYVLSNNDLNSTIIEPGGFLILDKSVTNISLNNTNGEELNLFDENLNLITHIYYIDAAGEDWSWARDENGDYHWTTSLTQDAENIITSPVSDNAGSSTTTTNEAESEKKVVSKYSEFKDKILITEFLPNPVGIDKPGNEWLELYNTSTLPIYLRGWKLRDNQTEYVFQAGVIESQSWLVLNNFQTGLSFNNFGGDELELIDTAGKSVFKISYKNQPVSGQSYNFCSDYDKWMWLDEVSPGSENLCPPINQNPFAYFEISSRDVFKNQTIVLDAHESYDVDGQIEKYRWHFSQPVEIVNWPQVGLWDSSKIVQDVESSVSEIRIKFLNYGKCEINLTVVDDLGGQDEYENSVEVKIDQSALPDLSGVEISEILPNPHEADAEFEFIELYNAGLQTVDLSLLKLGDEQMSDKYGLTGQLGSKKYIAVYRPQSKIALNNDSDQVQLFDVFDNLIDEVAYQGTTAGRSYAKSETGKWSWTESVTPGEKNIFGRINGSASSIFNPKAGYFQDFNLADIRKYSIGSQVSVDGKVSVEPGVLGANIFYIAGSGVQIYSYAKDFPALTLGDRVRINGEISTAYGETRIKTKNRNDIVVVESSEPPDALKISSDMLGDDYEGSLISVSGEMVDVNDQELWLADDMGEIRIVVKPTTGIDLKNLDIKIGDKIQVIGILSETQSGWRVLPRYTSDISLLQVLGATDREINKSDDDRNENFKYILTLAIFVLILAGFLVFRIYKIRKEGQA